MTRVIHRMSEIDDAPWPEENPYVPPGPSPPPRGERGKDALPRLHRDRAFWGMTVTQFLGAFNDSVFKQIVLLLCVQVVVVTSAGQQLQDQQHVPQFLFAVAFVLFSGVAGFWADRIHKQTIIILCKVAEVLVMLAAVGAFAYTAEIGMPWLVLLVLFLMGTQSAVFGPAKYGILPEMVRARDLPAFNGVIQMTTFLALIFGTALGGYLLQTFRTELWKAGAVCVGIAVVGTLTSLLVRRTPVAQPDARFRPSAMYMSPDTRRVLWQDRSLITALVAYSLFWFMAAVIPLSVNALGKIVFQLSDLKTSLMLACISIGIAVGCVMAGRLSAGRVRFGLVRTGTWGLVFCLLLLSSPGIPSDWLHQAGLSPQVVARLPGVDTPHLLGYNGSQVTLAVAGLFAGLVAVPLQVFLQAKPPDALKGRMIGTMNLINWIGIILSAGFYFVCQSLLDRLELPTFLTFGATALLILLPIALFYRPTDVELEG